MASGMTADHPPGSGRIGAGLDRRQVLVGGALVALAGAGIALKPRRLVARLVPGELDEAIPRAFGEYSEVGAASLVLPPKDDLSAKLYDAVLARVYAAPGRFPIGLCIAYGSAQDAGLQLHRPDECYPAQGFTISDQQSSSFMLADRAINATSLTASRTDRTDQLLYWTRIGSVFPPDSSAERKVIVSENLRGRVPDGVLTRLSVMTADRNRANSEMREFASQLISSLGTSGKRILLGNSGPHALFDEFVKGQYA